MAEDAKGFLGRWARRKTDALQGKPLDEPLAPAKPATRDGAAVKVSSSGPAAPELAAVPPSGDVVGGEPPEEKTLSLDDVKLLTRDSDFKPFMANNVGAQVRNAAMKKLFADPHFNVMDGLDIYVGDYSQPDPISPSMLRQMAGAKFLNLFDSAEKGDAEIEAGAEKLNTAASLPREFPPGPDAAVAARPNGNPENPYPDPVRGENFAQSALSPDAAASPPGPDPGPAMPDAGRDAS